MLQSLTMGFSDLELKYANQVISGVKSGFESLYDPDTLNSLRNNKALVSYIEMQSVDKKIEKRKSREIRAEKILEYFDQALDALAEILGDREHKDRLKAIEMVLGGDLVYRKAVGNLKAEQDTADKDQRDKKANININVIK